GLRRPAYRPPAPHPALLRPCAAARPPARAVCGDPPGPPAGAPRGPGQRPYSGGTVPKKREKPENPETAEKREKPVMFPDGTGPSASAGGPHQERRIRRLQPRRGRVPTGQRAALRRLWPRWGFDIDGKRRLDLAELFADMSAGQSQSQSGDPEQTREAPPVVLEIGFGMGEATAEMAAAEPDT